MPSAEAVAVRDILAKLKALGDPARHTVNAKAGAPANQFGVKLGDLRALAKQLKIDHALALKLWDTGNVEAQLLAALAMKPKQLAADDLDALTRATTCAPVADWLNAYVVRDHPAREALRQRWMTEPTAASPRANPWPARAGWNLTAGRINKGQVAGDGNGGWPLDLPALLDRIEAELASAAAEVQWTMNNTLAAIGIHAARLRPRALAIGERVGLYRDWPAAKGCVIPYVPVWVAEMVKRKGQQ